MAKDHYVAQTYLDRFCDSEANLWVYDKKWGKIKPKTTGQVCYEHGGSDKRKQRGWVFTVYNFLDVASRSEVSNILSRLAKKGIIRRLERGIYYYPKESKLLGPLSPTPDNIAIALAVGDRIFPTGAMAANLLGLSTQVPAQIMYFTNATTRQRRVAGQTIRLKRARIAWIDHISGRANLTIQALSYLGRRYIDERTISRCARVLSDIDIDCLHRVADRMPYWMAGVVLKIRQVKNQQMGEDHLATR